MGQFGEIKPRVPTWSPEKKAEGMMGAGGRSGEPGASRLAKP